MSVIVYSAVWCPWCQKTKEFLKEHNVEFEERDIEKMDGAADEVVKKSGQRGIPVIDVDGTIIVGYDKEALKEALGIGD
ncbi:MAG: glutaredoxin family protein [Candidatus Hydrothermarchaeaceae archaeon]